MILARLFLLVLISSPLAAGPLDMVPAALDASPHETGAVRAISDGDTLTLSSGIEIRLVGIQAPKLPLGRPDFEEWPLAERAKAHLAGLVEGEELLAAYGGARRDRHGRALAHLFRLSDGAWLQKQMLLAGLARVYSFSDNRAMVAELLEFERAARAARQGIWRHPFYAIRTTDQLERHAGPAGHFHLIEGRVTSVAHFRDQSYINFGADYKTDFTIAIDARDRKRFGTGDDPDRDKGRVGEAWLSGLEGKQVRVRGWLFFRNGPMVKLTHPEQIELLD